MPKVTVTRDDGMIETRTLDKNGNANGPYTISNGIETIESGNLKNGKKDGLCDDPSLRGKLEENAPDELGMAYYKDGKKQVLKTALLHAGVRIVSGMIRFVEKEQEKEKITTATETAKAHYFLTYIKDLVMKVIDKLPRPKSQTSFVPVEKKENYDTSLPQFRESFVPIRHVSNRELLAKHSEPIIPKIPVEVRTAPVQASPKTSLKKEKLSPEVFKHFQAGR